MALPDSFIQELISRNDIESVVSSYVRMKRRGRNLVGLCPFHGEKTPSFTLYPDTESFYCFGAEREWRRDHLYQAHSRIWITRCGALPC